MCTFWTTRAISARFILAVHKQRFHLTKKQCKGQHTSRITKWESSTVLKNAPNAEEPRVADGSQLAVARPDTDDETLRVFYQEKANASGKRPLRELKYSKGRRGEKWEVQTGQILGALENSRLSAVSARNSGDVRLYYQGENGRLLESFWNNRNEQWNDRRRSSHFKSIIYWRL